MNANSKQPAPTIKQWLHATTTAFQKADIPSARLDAELILADTLGYERTRLISHDAMQLTKSVLHHAEHQVSRRLKREPLAYIRGYKEFYGRNFSVTPDTLIPRPDTETVIELLRPLVGGNERLIDVGTGSGVIAITAKLEFPTLTVDATDISKAALKVATDNAAALDAAVSFHISDLLGSVAETYDIICANLPYVDTAWQVSAETQFEPKLALFADDDGLELIKKLIDQATKHLRQQGYLLLEADPRQHDAIISYGHTNNFTWHQTEDFIVVLQKA